MLGLSGAISELASVGPRYPLLSHPVKRTFFGGCRSIHVGMRIEVDQAQFLATRISVCKGAGAISKHIRNEYFYPGDKGIEIFFAEKNSIFKIHQIILVCG